MLYNDYKGINMPRLGFGAMRLPTLPGGEIDRDLTFKMVDYAMANGVNYFDTAYPYHDGMSEIVMGEALSRYPRESYMLADKFPGHQVMSNYDPATIFEEQLKKCGVDYFDFYLLHNVNEQSIEVYRDERWGIIDYFIEQRRLGRIKHLGFSTHARPDCLRECLDEFGDEMEFCQIQLNYLDWTLQHAREKYEMLTERGIAVWVMEPVRGGRLASLTERAEAALREHRPTASVASWAFRWLQGLDNVKMVLSGMSNMEHIADNVATFSTDEPLSRKERELLYSIAEGMKDTVPCTSCKYCLDSCPLGLNIPMFMATYNDFSFSLDVNSAIHVQSLPKEKLPSACVTCGRCTRVCPQNIDIPLVNARLARMLERVPSWEKICRDREEAAKRAFVEK